MTVKQFKLPDLGEGLTEGDILKWMVAVGDVIEVNDTIAEVETVKAAVELPSPFAGRVTGLHADEGETVPVGTPIISIEVVDAPSPASPADVEPPAGVGADMVPTLPAAGEEKQMTLVGYGPRDEGGGRRRRRRAAEPNRAEVTAAGANTAMNLPPATAPHPAPDLDATEDRVAAMPAATVESPSGRHAADRPLAKPPVRKLAKTLGVDLAVVQATGSGGIITREDVQSAVNGHQKAVTTPSAMSATRETRIPIKGVRKHTAAAMVASAFTAPHVTEFVTVDVTATMDLRDRVAARREFRDVKVSPLLFVAKAVMIAAAHTPELNSTWDDAAGEIVQKHYVNLGVAAATPRGLVVPNIKDAQTLSLLELTHAIGELADTARAGRTTPEAMSGGTFTISNVGVFGVDTGTPILNPGESGILAFGAVRRMPWVIGSGADERIEPRWVTQLGLSFDHRVVDGEQGSRFLAEVAGILHDPGLALL